MLKWGWLSLGGNWKILDVMVSSLVGDATSASLRAFLTGTAGAFSSFVSSETIKKL